MRTILYGGRDTAKVPVEGRSKLEQLNDSQASLCSIDINVHEQSNSDFLPCSPLWKNAHHITEEINCHWAKISSIS
jgi:hypothetical protein